jgi:hypothetical protein
VLVKIPNLSLHSRPEWSPSWFSVSRTDGAVAAHLLSYLNARRFDGGDGLNIAEEVFWLEITNHPSFHTSLPEPMPLSSCPDAIRRFLASERERVRKRMF